MSHLSYTEVLRSVDMFYVSLYGADIYEKWKTLKQDMNFATERHFVRWMLDFIERYSVRRQQHQPQSVYGVDVMPSVQAPATPAAYQQAASRTNVPIQTEQATEYYDVEGEQEGFHPSEHIKSEQDYNVDQDGSVEDLGEDDDDGGVEADEEDLEEEGEENAETTSSQIAQTHVLEQKKEHDRKRVKKSNKKDKKHKKQKKRKKQSHCGTEGKVVDTKTSSSSSSSSESSDDENQPRNKADSLQQQELTQPPQPPPPQQPQQQQIHQQQTQPPPQQCQQEALLPVQQDQQPLQQQHDTNSVYSSGSSVSQLSAPAANQVMAAGGEAQTGMELMPVAAGAMVPYHDSQDQDNGMALMPHTPLYHVPTAEKPFPCQTCSASFANRQQLAQHQNTVHVSGQEYRCKYCESVFFSKSDRLSHIIEEHNDVVKCHSCQLCGQKFTTRSVMLAHQRAVHTQRELMCTFCEKTFNWPQALTLHKKRVHLGMCFTCDICQKRLSSRQALLNHITKLHKDAHALAEAITMEPQTLGGKEITDAALLDEKLMIEGAPVSQGPMSGEVGHTGGLPMEGPGINTPISGMEGHHHVINPPIGSMEGHHVINTPMRNVQAPSMNLEEHILETPIRNVDGHSIEPASRHLEGHNIHTPTNNHAI